MEDVRAFSRRFGDRASALARDLDRNPDNPSTLHNLGVVAFEAREIPLALQLLERAVHLAPNHAMCHGSLAAVLELADNPERAKSELDIALRLDPRSAESLYNFAIALRQKGALPEAIDCFERALAVNPDHLFARNNLGLSYMDVNQLDRAAACFEQLLAVRPGWVTALTNLASVRRRQGDLARAEQLLRQAIESEPNNPAAHNGLAIILSSCHRLAEALEEARRATELGPNHPETFTTLGSVLVSLGHQPEALKVFERAIALEPRSTNCYQALLFLRHYLGDVTPEALTTEHVRWAQRFAPPLKTPRSHRNIPDPERRLRIGFVSADLHQHPVAYFLAPVLEARDPNRIEVACYNAGPEDSWSNRLRQSAALWRSVRELGDADLARTIEEDGIDILIDLAGHTGGNRLPVFARKPAPVQASWLGYFNTTGISAVDYLITDSQIAPPDEKSPFLEEPLRLDGCYLAYAPPPYAPAVAPAPFLTSGHVTYGCFNALSKIGPQVLATWAEILRRDPQSRLTLKDRAFANRPTQLHILAEFEKLGIDPARVDMLGFTTHPETLAAYSGIDIALDPYPYNGGTTTCEALSMGVPVVTLRGDRFVSRVGSTILTAAGLPELIAHNEEEYIAKAIEMGSLREGLAELRLSMRAILSQSVLWDTKGFARKLENAYREIWRRWCGAQRA